jgi:DNA-binding protein H-NS
LRLLREAPPEATPQAPQQPEVISRQSSVDALYDHAKSLLPDNAQQVEQELFSIQDDISTLRKELKKLTVGTPEHTAKQAEWKAAQTRLVAKWEEKAAIDGAAARKLLQSLQHETPQTAQVTFSIKGLSAADRARVEELIKLTAGIAPDTGTPMSVTVKTLNLNGAGAAWSGSGARGTLYINPQNIPDVYVIHETLHGLQSNYQYGVRATDEWAAPRITGESARRMSTLDPTRYGHMPNNYIAYKDAVEDVQTLHAYKKGSSAGTQLPEVLTMPITSLTQSTNGRDPDLLRLFLQIAKDGGK